jgi:hypothetical protein
MLGFAPIAKSKMKFFQNFSPFFSSFKEFMPFAKNITFTLKIKFEGQCFKISTSDFFKNVSLFQDHKTLYHIIFASLKNSVF